MSSISGFFGKHHESVAFTAAGALIGASSTSSPIAFVGRLIAGATIPGTKSIATKICSAVAFTGLQWVAESYLSNNHDPLCWLSKTISVTLFSASIHYFINPLQQRREHILLLTLGTLLSSISSIRNVATVIGMGVKAIGMIGCSNVTKDIFLEKDREKKIDNAKNAAIFCLATSAISIAASYFHGPLNPFFHIGILTTSLGNTLLIGRVAALKTLFTTLAITTLATIYFYDSYHPAVHCGVIAAVFTMYNWDIFQYRSEKQKKVEPPKKSEEQPVKQTSNEDLMQLLTNERKAKEYWKKEAETYVEKCKEWARLHSQLAQKNRDLKQKLPPNGLSHVVSKGLEKSMI